MIQNYIMKDKNILIEGSLTSKMQVTLFNYKQIFNLLMVLNLDQQLEWEMNQLLDILYNFIQVTEDTLK